MTKSKREGNGVVRRKGTEKNGVSSNGSLSNGVSNGYHKSSPVAGEPEPSSLATRLIHHLHFSVMPLLLMLTTPNLVLVIWYTAAKCDGSYLAMATRLGERGLLGGLGALWQDVRLLNGFAPAVILGYSVWAMLLMKILPGPRVEGPVTPKGNVPIYTDNGFYCYVVTMLAFVGLTAATRHYDLPSPSLVYDRFDEILATLTLASLLVCVLLYAKGVSRPSTTDAGTSGNPVFDYYWGTELYPRVMGIDVKVFTNCRFGMTVWPLLVAIFWLKSYELYGFVDSMAVCALLQLTYMTKFFWWEAGYMRTIDIMLDRAGYYICWGCLVYIPGVYCSTSLYMVAHPVRLGPVLAPVLLLAGLLSIAVNYWADYQKQLVRATDGDCLIWGRRPEVIRARYATEDGRQRDSLLLVSGFWGVSRHFHYLPELALSLCWCLPGLFANAMPYTYFFWLLALLTHRTFRDDDKCSRKYGQYWKEYCKKVPYRMVPGIF